MKTRRHAALVEAVLQLGCQAMRIVIVGRRQHETLRRAMRARISATSSAASTVIGRAQENIQGTLARLTVLSVLAGLTSGRRALTTTCSARCVDGPSIPPTIAQTFSA